MQLHVKIAISVVVLFVIPSGLCIKCFTCLSGYFPTCSYPFDNSTIPVVDCKHMQGLSNLTAVCQKVRMEVDGTWYYARGCALLEKGSVQGDENACINKKGLNNTNIEQCSCNNKDYCNSSSMLAPLPLLLATFAALSAGLRKVFVN